MGVDVLSSCCCVGMNEINVFLTRLLKGFVYGIQVGMARVSNRIIIFVMPQNMPIAGAGQLYVSLVT